MADYKIELGVKVDTNDIRTQINKSIGNAQFKKIKLELNTKQIDSKLNSIRKQIQGLSKIKVNLNINTGLGSGSGSSSGKNVANGINNTVNQLTTAYNKLKNITKNIGSIKIKLSGLDSANDIRQIQLLEKQLQSLTNEYHKTVYKIKGKGDLSSTQWQSVQQQIDNAKIKLEQLKKEIADAKTQLANGFRGNFGNYDAQVQSLNEKFGKLSNQSVDVEKNINKVKMALADMKNASSDEELIAAAKRYQQALKKSEAQLKKNKSLESQVNNAAALAQSKEKLSLTMSNWLKDNSKAARLFGNDIKKLQIQLKQCGNADDVKRVSDSFGIVKQKAKEAGVATKTFGDSLKAQFAKYKDYLSIATIFMYTTQALKSMFDQVLAIDTAMTELKKVTDETDVSYNQFLSNAASRAKEIGTTIDGLVASTADFARLGYGFKESQGLAEVANIYAVVGDDIDSVETATQSLISTLTAFKDEANGLSNDEFALSIVDKMNEVSNNFAISSGGIGEALQRSASSMMAANNSLDETIALITAANTVVQDPDSVGTAFKTISMRIRGAETELEEAGLDADGMAESTAKLREEIMALSGVDIMLDSSTFKSTYQIMEELAAKWQDLTDIQQASITELIAGKRQGNIVSSLMNNFDIAQSALQTSLGSSGSAMKEHSKYMDSMEAKLSQLKAAWQSFAQTFMDSDFLKVGIDALSGLVNIIDELIDKIGTLPTIFSIVAAFKSFGKVSSVANGVGGLKSISDVITTLGMAFPNAAKGISIFTAALKGGAGIAGVFKAAVSGLWAVVAAHPILATVAAVGLAIVAFDNFTESAEELAEKVGEVTSKFKEQHDELLKLKGDYNTSNEDSMVSRYEKLSKGVDGLGRNISLTADEYSEYQDIVNNIADQIPSLVSGYDEQGNAILSCKGNVEELIAAYENLIHIQNQEILKTNGSDIEENWKNTTSQANGYDFWEKIGNALSFDGVFGGKMDTYDMKTDTAEWLKGLKPNTSQKDIATELSTWSEIRKSEVKQALQKEGYDVNLYTDISYTLADILKDEPQKIQDILNNYYDGLAESVEEYKTKATALLSEAFDVSSEISGLNYGNISEELQTIAYQTVNGLDFDFLNNLTENGITIEQWTTEMLDQLNSISKADNAQIEAAFDLQTQFNGGKISYGEYVKGLKDVQTTIDGLNLKGEAKEQLEISLGLDENGIIDQYNALKNRLVDKYKDDVFGDVAGRPSAINRVELEILTEEAEQKADEFLSKLSVSEYKVAVDLIANEDIDLSNFDYNSLKEYIEKQAKILEAMEFTIAIDVETESVEALNTAMAESVSGAGLSSESIAKLESRYAELESQGYDLSSMFEETANGIHLNKKAVDELERAYASDKLAETDKNLGVLKNRYNELTNEINNCSDASERAGLYREQQEIVQKINDLGTLAAQYEGLASSYNAWLSAEESGSERDMYERIIEGFETVGDEISRGWMDDGTIKFLELMTGRTDLATLSAKELKQVWKGLDKTIENTSYSVRDFFTVDEDGNSTSKGVYNFLDAVGQLEEEKFGGKDVVKRDDKDNIIGFDFKVAGGDEAIAEALGISEELVQIMLRAADDAGFVVTLDGNWTQFADLQNQAEASNDALKKLAQTNEHLKNAGFGEYDFDFDANTVEGINTELDKAKELLNNDAFKDKDGNFNINVEGAKDALKIAETLQIAKSKLEEPAYMSIDTSGLQKELQEPVKQLQEFEKLTQEKDLLNLTGTDKERLSEIDTELDKIATNLSELPDETKIDLGIDGMTPEQIREELENGTIEVPAKLTLEANMDKNLEDLVTLGLLEQGLIDEKEAKIRLGIEVEVDEESESNLSEKMDKLINGTDIKVGIEPDIEVKTPTETLDGMLETLDGYSDAEIEVITRFLADPSEVETYEPEDKKAVIKYIADTMDVDGYTPEEKEAYAKYLVDGGNLDAYIPEEKQAIAKYLVDGGDIEDYEPEDQDAIVKFLKNTVDIDNYTPEQKQAIAKFIKDSIEPDTYQPPAKIQDVTADLNSSEVDDWQPPSKTMTVWAQIKKKASDLWSKLTGGGGVDGTAHVDGTAFINGTTSLSGRAYKQGDWGTKDSGIALGGEEAPELLVRNGRWHLIGEKGAEFFGYKKGDIIFNASQTKEIFEKGKITHGNSRGKALVSGTAFSSGSGGGIYPEVKSYTVGKTPSSKKKSSSSSSSAADEFEESLDWIEIAIDRIERAIDQLDQKANNVYKSWSSRNNALTSEISKVGDEISLQQKAYERYMQEAANVGLSESYAEKVRNGTIDIETITDEDLNEKISEYQDFYEKALDCKDAIEELKETEASLYAQRFENVQTQYDAILQGYEHTESMLNEYISQAEEQGHIVSKKYYQALINNEKSNIAELKKEQADLIVARDEAVASGKITKYSEEWYNMCNEIDGVTQSIEESTTALIEFDNAMRDIDWSIFDLVQERISDITAESEFLIELMSNEKLFDDNGKFTEQGVATVGLHALNYNTAMYQADDYGAEVSKLDKQIAKDPYDQDLINRRRELIELQRESILAAEDEKNSIRDLVEEGIELELDALQERIDLHNEELDSMKDLYDYQKNVEEQTENIASLRKQLGAYEGFDDEETRAKVQELKVSLEEAEADLKETEYDKFISDQTALLDTLYTEYETILNSRLDNIDFLLEQVIDGINAAAGAEGTITSALGTEGAIAIALGNNATTIGQTLKTEVGNVGTKLSTAMSNIWLNDGSGKAIIDLYGKDFQNKQTTTNTTLNSIKTDIAAMVDDVDKDAQKKVVANKTTTSAKKDPVKTTTTTKKPATTTNKNTSTASKSKATDDDIMGIAASIWIYGNASGWGNDPVRSGKVTEKFDAETAKKVQSIINAKGANGGLYKFWLDKNQNLDKYKYSAYKSGARKIDSTQLAWTQENGTEFIVRPSDGAILTPIAKSDSILNASASNNIWNMANSPAEFIKDNLKLDASSIPNASNVNNSVVQNFENITFSMPNVHGYNDLLTEMQRDPKFEKLVLSMTVDRIAGKSALAKGKSIR